ncbi:uncharacterized protein LOC125764134 isoform X1 [Anopheles funestus]|uniref:uncharacterized protein LOC125764134 isoform X1 n=1 Tax=Anopheles funestus TaxID=62324 RepID=UPI0020C5F155|nr:uncharacterized protein LOC125764134 isoform X1 [Anopheles funestus]
MYPKKMRKTGLFYRIRDKRRALFQQQWREEHGETSSANASSSVNEDEINIILDNVESQSTPYSESDCDIGSSDDNAEELAESDDSYESFGEDSSDGDIYVEGRSFEDKLRIWALLTNQTHRALNMLLTILREDTSFMIPKDARTLLKTPVSNENNSITTIVGGQLWYQGIASSLQHQFSKTTPNVETLWLDFFVDGIPLHRSGVTEFWPILMKVFGLAIDQVLVVAVYCGDSKPMLVEEYLRPMVTELNHLQQNGILINGSTFQVSLRAIIADTPARCLIKGVKSCNSASGCLKCNVKVVRDPETRRAYYDGINGEPRTDELFRANAYPTHYKNPTPLTDVINFDMIKDIPVADELHLLYLGVMRKILLIYMGKLGKQSKFSPKAIEEISTTLRLLKLPSEIPRRMRGLNCIKVWKGTEFQSFLLYASVVVLKGRITDDAYNHFMLLFCAVHFFSSAIYEHKWEYAGQLLNLYIENFGEVYDKTLQSSNIHNLHHVYEDVCRFGPLYTISSYPYENFLQHMKRVTRGKKNCLEQIRNRTIELRHINEVKNQERSAYPRVVQKRNETITFIKHNFRLRKDNRNQWFMTKSYSVLSYESAIQTPSGVTIYGRKFKKYHECFSTPCNSSVLHMCEAVDNDLDKDITAVNISEIKCKLAAISTVKDNPVIFIPVPETFMLTE